MSTLGWRDIGAYGEALLDQGLAVRQGISGVGLVTRGSLYGVYDIYIDTETSVTTTWADSSASVTTSWTDTDTLSDTPIQAIAFFALFRPSVQYGGITIGLGVEFLSSTGVGFATYSTLLTASYGSSGYNTWSCPYGGSAVAGDVYQDAEGHTWTVKQNWGPIGFLQTYGATLSYSEITNGCTLTRVSGSGSPYIGSGGAVGDDFYKLVFTNADVGGTAGNGQTISSIVTPLSEPNFTIEQTYLSGNGDGTGWVDSNFGMYSEAVND